VDLGDMLSQAEIDGHEVTLGSLRTESSAQVVAIKSKPLAAWDAVLHEVLVLEHVRHPQVARLVDMFCGQRLRLVLGYAGQVLLSHASAQTWSLEDKVDSSCMTCFVISGYVFTGALAACSQAPFGFFI
jgi:hypothetical protein